jgi:DNA-directed RNA polymerase specialized sigma24 family protein
MSPSGSGYCACSQKRSGQINDLGNGADTVFGGEMLKAIPSLRAFARSLDVTPENADDLVQETMVKPWANRHRFVAGTNLRTWLFTILRKTIGLGFGDRE